MRLHGCNSKQCLQGGGPGMSERSSTTAFLSFSSSRHKKGLCLQGGLRSNLAQMSVHDTTS